MSRRSRRVTVALGMATAAFVSMPQSALASPTRVEFGLRQAEVGLRDNPGLREAIETRDGDALGLQLLEPHVRYEE